MLTPCLLLYGCSPPELPESWPQDLPPYPGSVLTGASVKQVRGSASSGRQELLSLELRTIDDPSSVLKYYAEAAQTAGYVQDSAATSSRPDGSVTSAFAKDRQRLELSAWNDERRTRGNTDGAIRMTKAHLALYLPLE